MRLLSLFCFSFLAFANASNSQEAKYDLASQVQDPLTASRVIGILKEYVLVQERFRQDLLAALGPDANVYELLEHAQEYVASYNNRQRMPVEMTRDLHGLMPQPMINGHNRCFIISLMQSLGSVKGSVFSVPQSNNTPLLSKMSEFLAQLHKPRLGKPLNLDNLVTGMRQNDLLAGYFNGRQMDATEVLSIIYGVLIEEQPRIGNVLTWKEARETKDPNQPTLRISGYEPHQIGFLEITQAFTPVYPEDRKNFLASQIQVKLERALSSGNDAAVSQLLAQMEQLNATRPVIPDLPYLIEKYYSMQTVDNMTSRLKRVGPLPLVYTVALKRFESNSHGASKKIETPVIIPEHLMLTSDSFMDYQSVFCPSSKASYRLQAVIMHSGTLHGGHYISLVRIGDNWFLCNDASITPSTLQLIASGNYLTFTPYILIYHQQ